MDIRLGNILQINQVMRMSRIRYVTSVIVMIILMSFSKEKTPDYCKISSEIVNQFIADMGKKHKLSLYGSGGSYMYNVKKINLAFMTHGPKSEEELRELMVEIVTEMLNRINCNDEIRKYLNNYPFNEDNLEFDIYMVNKDGSDLKNKSNQNDILQGVILLEGKLRYIFANEEKRSLQTRKRESYSDALEILKKKNPRLYNELFYR